MKVIKGTFNFNNKHLTLVEEDIKFGEGKEYLYLPCKINDDNTSEEITFYHKPLNGDGIKSTVDYWYSIGIENKHIDEITFDDIMKLNLKIRR